MLNFAGKKGMIKAIFFDIDGTLVSFKTHQIPQSAIYAIMQAKKHGIKIYISTGRPFPLINNIDEIKHLVDGYITANGAYCFVGDEIILCQPIPEEDVRTVIKCADEKDFACMVVGEKDLAMYRNNVCADRIFHQMLNVSNLQANVLIEPIIRQRILQLTPVISRTEEERLMSLLPGCESCRWYPDFADITAKNVNKGNGLLAIAAYQGIKVEETMALGDGGNDISIIKRAGIGVAMGNANDSLKAVADYVTYSVDKDGVYHALKRWVSM